MRLTDFDNDESPRLPMDFVNNMKHTSDFDDMSVPYFDRLAVLVMEGIATPEERAEYAKLLKDNDKNQESASIYAKCRLSEDEDIQYPAPQKLKRGGRVLPLLWKISAAAAVAAVGCFAIYNTSSEDSEAMQIAYTSQYVCNNARVTYEEHDAELETVNVLPAKQYVEPVTQYVANDFINDEPAYEYDEPETNHDEVSEYGIVMAGTLTRIPEAPVGLIDAHTIYMPETEAKDDSWIVAFLKNKYQNIKNTINFPIKLKRNASGEIEEYSITAFNKTITYRKML